MDKNAFPLRFLLQLNRPVDKCEQREYDRRVDGVLRFESSPRYQSSTSRQEIQQ